MNIRITGVIAACVMLSQFGGVAAQDAQSVIALTQTANDIQAIYNYWTPQRMAAAVPMEPPPQLVSNLPASGTETVTYGDPGFVNGWMPGSQPYVEQRVSFPRTRPESLFAPQTFGVAPTNPLSGPYGPFQRWSMHGTYLGWPRALHGKFFFTLNGLDFVCSATPINRSTIATAGHCVNDGTNTYITSGLFCPSYTNGAANPARGCWALVAVLTSAAWNAGGDPDYDYACGITHTAGTLINNKLGNVTGWAGRAWNWVDVMEVVFGYPQGAPFNGNVIQQVVAPDWYNVDFVAGGQVSKAIGSDMTGGSSGGGWFLSWRHPATEFPDTDGSGVTDPAGAQNGPFINGVNSHKRCASGCFTPPTAVAGTFWQEMTSPPFRSTAAGDESEDVFAVCFAHVNNN
jgi:hypothetical protein